MSRRRGGASWWRPILMIALPVLISTAAAVTVLLTVLNPGTAAERLDTVRTGLAVGAGIGALITLALALRRQQATEHDATERRLTELYVKAVDQLGSDKAAVRQGGLYALERVAQDNADHRQTIVDVICAYLRSPYTPPRAPGSRKLQGLRAPLRPTKTRPCSGIASEATSRSADQETHQEREVRLTAQRILRDHLRPQTPARSWTRWLSRPALTFWPDINLDLTGATLIDFDLSNARTHGMQFKNSTFKGSCNFENIKTRNTTRFDEAEFEGFANFDGGHFGGFSSFNSSLFKETAAFANAQFKKGSSFSSAKFNANAYFYHARFDRRVTFNKARVTGYAEFGRAYLVASDFREANFGGLARFVEAEFDYSANFISARFNRDANFREAHFHAFKSVDELHLWQDLGSEAEFVQPIDSEKNSSFLFNRAIFCGDAKFNRTRFDGSASFEEAQFLQNSEFTEAYFLGDVELSQTRFNRVPEELAMYLGSD
ncbi:pentapeptide repeat-containing protein [Lentzea sp. JNUCC 0626]|uniref:pentapeptide repeat-containing protein n=1 Tax=Lentzea sp. JNUCC 0626 TaxID=3367513 RepID=UPI0037483A39